MLNKIHQLLSDKLLKGAGIFLLANIFDKAIPFVALPIFTRLMSPHDFGLFSQFSIVVLLANYFVGLTSEGALGVYFFKAKNEYADFVTNAVWIVLVNFLIFVTVFALFKDTLADWASLTTMAILAALINGLFFSLFLFLQTTLRAEGDAVSYGSFQVLRSLTDIGLSALLILKYDLSWYGRVWGIVGANIIWGGFAFVWIYRKNLLRFNYNKKVTSQILNFAVPLLPHAIGGWLLSASDRFLVNKLLGPEVNARYAVGFTFGMLVSVLTQSFNQAWAPYLFKELTEATEQAKLKLVKFTYKYFIGILLVALCVGLFSSLLLQLFFTQSYQGSSKYIGFISLAFAFDGMYLMVTNYIFFTAKTYILSSITICTGLVKAALTYFMITYHGDVGAAISVPICYFFQFVVTWYVASRVYKMPWGAPLKMNRFLKLSL